MKKRGFSLLLAILILAAQIPFAFAVTASGTCGGNLTWTLDDSGTLTITGKGAMDSYNLNSPSSPWFYYRDRLYNIVIDENVTNIGDSAFSDCYALDSAAIPYGVEHIGYLAFARCSNLKSVIIPSSISLIRKGVFADCSKLNRIIIAGSVITIEEGAFLGCDSLQDIYYGGSQQQWEAIDIFEKNESLSNATIHYNNTDPDSKSNTPSSNDGSNKSSYGGAGRSSLSGGGGGGGGGSSSGGASSGASSSSSKVMYTISLSSNEGGSLNTSEKKASADTIITVEVTPNLGYRLDTLTVKTRAGKDVDVVERDGTYSFSMPKASVTVTAGFVAIQQPNSPSDTSNSNATSTPSTQSKNNVRQYSYAFANKGVDFGYPVAYRVPLERFQLVYGNGFAKKMKAVDFGGGSYWSGNCYGIATTAAMLSRAGSGVTPSDFRNGATRPGELQVSDSAAKLGLTLAQFIEAMQISQYSATFAATRKQNRDNLSGLLSAMSAFEEGGFGPLVICVYGNDKNGVYSGHALLAYHLDGQRLYVYDCNHPNDESRYITISNSGWSYPISDGVTWNNSNGDITYIQYETYLMDWYSRGRLLGDPEQLRQVMFFINSADATISDSYGNEIAAFQNGKMIRGIDEAYPIPQLGVTADGVSVARPQIAVWLPLSNGYSVTTRESATVSSVNLSRGVSVSQVAGGQTVSVSLSSYKPQFDDVFPGQYFYDPVMWAVGREITNGTTATTFEPAKTCTRNHILTFLWRANGSPAASIGNPFADVNPATTFGKAALWAYEKGLVSGTRFNGETPCTRAEAVTYLWKLAGRPTAGRSAFTDVPTNADYAQAVSWAVERGITNGTSQTTFNPSGTCTRGQIATFLYRAYA